MSNLFNPLAGIKLISPRPVRKEIPPAAASESVHPGNGCSKDEAIIDGRSKHTFKSPLFFKRAFSARFLVKV